MDCYPLQVNSCNRSSLITPCLQRPFYCNNVKAISVSKLKTSYSDYRPLVIRAIGKKGDDGSSFYGSSDQSVPEEDGSSGSSPTPERNNSDDITTFNLHHKTSDWRTARASLVIWEPALLGDTDALAQDGVFQETFKPLGPKWAHPITVPETGCVLVATEKLDGVPHFERTVVLLLRSGNKGPYEGPFGVIINHPVHKGIRHVKPMDFVLPTIFTDCSLHFGGPIEASLFLLNKPENSQLPGSKQVIPNVCFGDRNSLREVTRLVRKGVLRPQDLRFFFGYAGWQFDQLREEIESGYWYVASCSEYFINGSFPDSSSEDLWGEILQLMGGHYSDTSRKPKQDGL